MFLTVSIFCKDVIQNTRDNSWLENIDTYHPVEGVSEVTSSSCQATASEILHIHVALLNKKYSVLSRAAQLGSTYHVFRKIANVFHNVMRFSNMENDVKINDVGGLGWDEAKWKGRDFYRIKQMNVEPVMNEEVKLKAPCARASSSRTIHYAAAIGRTKGSRQVKTFHMDGVSAECLVPNILHSVDPRVLFDSGNETRYPIYTDGLIAQLTAGWDDMLPGVCNLTHRRCNHDDQ